MGDIQFDQQTVTGTITHIDRDEIALESLARYPVALQSCRSNTGLALDATGGDTLFSIVNAGIGVGTLTLKGEEALSETEITTLCFEFALPPEYIANEDVKINVQAKYDDSSGGTVGAKTIDCEVYELGDDGTGGSDLCTTAAQTLTTSFADYSFTVTDTALTAGDRLIVYVQTVIEETAGGGALFAVIGSIEVQLDIRG